MKYSLHINQLTWQWLCPEADIRHSVVFEAIKSICNSPSKNIIRDGEGFTWVSSNVILNELPMLKIKTKGGISPLIKDLNEWGMIEIKREIKTGNQFYKITEKAEKLDRKVDNENTKHLLDSVNDPVRNSKRPRLQNLTDHYTKDHNTKIKIVETPKNGKCKKFSKDSPEFQLSRFSIDQIRKTHPHLKFSKSIIDKACLMFDRMVKRDGKSAAEIHNVLSWLPYSPRDEKSGFSWKDVVQSPLALRRKDKNGVMKYDKLVSAMRANGVNYDDLIRMALDSEEHTGTEETVKRIFKYLNKKPKFKELSLRFIQNDLKRFSGYNPDLEILALRLRG